MNTLHSLFHKVDNLCARSSLANQSAREHIPSVIWFMVTLSYPFFHLSPALPKGVLSLLH